MYSNWRFIFSAIFADIKCTTSYFMSNDYFFITKKYYANMKFLKCMRTPVQAYPLGLLSKDFIEIFLLLTLKHTFY